MKRLYLVVLTVILGLFLVACERPLRDGEEGEVTPELPADILPDDGGILPEVLPADTNQSTTDGAIIDQPGSDAGAIEGDAAEGSDAAPADGSAETGDETTPSDAAAVEEQPAATDIIHVVQVGEVLSTIAEQYDIPMADIIAANGLVNPDVLDVGDQLLIPLSGVITTEDNEAETPGAGDEVAGSERVHVVRAGDTLFRIGQIYGFTIEELATYNSIVNVNRLEVGQEIRIPPAE